MRLLHVSSFTSTPLDVNNYKSINYIAEMNTMEYCHKSVFLLHSQLYDSLDPFECEWKGRFIMSAWYAEILYKVGKVSSIEYNFSSSTHQRFHQEQQDVSVRHLYFNCQLLRLRNIPTLKLTHTSGQNVRTRTHPRTPRRSSRRYHRLSPKWHVLEEISRR